MMLPSHLLATLLACLLVSIVRPVAPREWLLALAFGVVIDLDHLVQLPRYVASQGTAALSPAAMLHWGAEWQGFMHTPWALAIVIPAALLFGSWFPVAFWGLHMVQDFVIAKHLVRFGSPLEWAIVAALLVAVSFLFARDHRLHGQGRVWWQHALARVGFLAP